MLVRAPHRRAWARAQLLPLRPPSTHTHTSTHAAGMATDAFEEFVVGHGELWCAQLTAARVRQMGGDCKVSPSGGGVGACELRATACALAALRPALAAR